MTPTVRKLLVALAFAAGTAAVGMGLAYAQSSTTTTPPSTTVPNQMTPQPDTGRRHCDHDRSGDTNDTTPGTANPTSVQL